MADRFIPYGRQSIDDDDVDAVIGALRSDMLTTGPLVGRFEQALCQSTGAPRAVAVNSGTAALHAAYFAAGLGPGDEIITSPLTFAATANAALYLGAAVRFVDIEPDTGNIDPEAIRTAITPRTKLIVPIDFTGHPADYDRINNIALDHKLQVVADAAHSLGATYRGRRVGTLADLTATSFHPVKPVTTAEGGAVLTNHLKAAARAEMFRTHGITRDPATMLAAEGPWSYEMHELGFNYRLSDIHSALGIAQLAKLDRFIVRRRQIAAAYFEGFRDTPGLILPTVRPDVEPGWHLFVIRVAGGSSDRLQLFNSLRKQGLGVQVHYIPVHYHPYYQRLGFVKGSLPLAENYYSRCISIPIFPAMADDDVRQVIQTVRDAAANIGR